MDEEATKEEDQDVRLCAALRGLLGGSKYVKQSELSRKVLLSYAIQKGGVVPDVMWCTCEISTSKAECSFGRSRIRMRKK